MASWNEHGARRDSGQCRQLPHRLDGDLGGRVENEPGGLAQLRAETRVVSRQSID